MRVDVENLYCDVVWREYKHTHQVISPGIHSVTTANILSPSKHRVNHPGTPGIYTSNAASVLRRERFSFDDIFAGPTAFGRLAAYTRLRVRQTLLYNKPSLVFLCVGCGEDAALYSRYQEGHPHASSIEPPAAVLLGDSGGQGLIATAVEEIFTSLPYLHRREAMDMYARPGKASGNISSSKARSHTHIHSQTHNLNHTSYVTLQAVVLLGDGDTVVVDLLCHNSQQSQCRIEQVQVGGSSGGGGSGGGQYKMVISNATTIQLKSPQDFDRLIGVIFGRRSMMSEYLLSVEARHREAAAGVGAGMEGWGGDSYRERDREGMGVRSAEGGVCFPDHLGSTPWLVPNEVGTLVITLTVHNTRSIYNPTSGSSGGSGMGGGRETSFHFVSPCGQLWSTPGRLG